MASKFFGGCHCCVTIPSTFHFWQVRITRSGTQTQSRADIANARAWLNAFDFDSITWPTDYRDRANYSWDNTTNTATFGGFATDDEPRYRSMAQIGNSESLWVLTRYRIDFGSTPFYACDLEYLHAFWPLPAVFTLEGCSGRIVSGIIFKDAPEAPATGTNVSRYDQIHWSTAVVISGVPYSDCDLCSFSSISFLAGPNGSVLSGPDNTIIIQ